MVCLLHSLAAAVPIFCFLHAVTDSTFEMWGGWCLVNSFAQRIKGRFRFTHARAGFTVIFYEGEVFLF
jgi:hypothetical protein